MLPTGCAILPMLVASCLNGRVSTLAELRELIARHLDQDVLPGVTVKASTTPTEPMPAVSQPAFAVVAQGTKRTMLADRVFEYGAGQYFLVSLELPVTGHVVRASAEEPYLVFGLTLRPALIASLLLESPAGGREPERGPDALGIGVSEVTGELLDPIVRLLRLLDRPADIPVLAAAAEREITWRLITGAQGAMVRRIGLADSRLSQISRAIRWIREHYADLFRIEDAARVAGMSVTSFYRHFHAATAMSPLQYQKQIRLQEARARLIAQPHDVAAVGFAVGYESASQFSHEYRRLFGRPPGQDIARLQAVPAADRIVVKGWRPP
jgi:AraC-like DNA-binding protein